MPAYRFYTIGPSGHICAPPAIFECPGDMSAIKEARKSLDGHDIEVWQGRRIVSYLVPESLAAKWK